MPRDKSDKDTDILTVMRARHAMGISAYADTRANELEDLRFFAGSPDNRWQWPDSALKTRSSGGSERPCLTINRLPQHVKQVTNDQRMNHPALKVIPEGNDADNEMAEVFTDAIRYIEYISDADVAYDTACDNQVIFGEGYFRILTEFCNEKTFDQDIKIGRIRNSFSVIMDPLIQDPSGLDQKWCFINEDMLNKEYEVQYPDALPVSTLKSMTIGDISIAQWIGEKTVRITEYFWIESETRTLNLYPGNQTAFEGTPNDKLLKADFGKPLRSRESEQKRVKWIKTNGCEILEERDWAGSYIPVIRVVGEEFEIDGELHISGLVRNAKDACRMYNYWASQEAEMLALAPKAPFIGYSGQFEGHENQWKTANTNNWPYLEVNSDVTDGQGAVLPLPQRSQPPMASSGLLQAKAGAADDIKAVTGQYNAALGMTSNERSGKAILARQRESDVGTYHYGSNLARAKRALGRQLVDLIPKIWDTDKLTLIIGEDGEPSMVEFDSRQPEAVRKLTDENGTLLKKIYNPAVGKYGVRVITGPGYATKRQEALESMAKLLESNAALWSVAGDLFAKEMDWPGAQALAKRLKKSIDPKLLTEDDDPTLAAANQRIEEMTAEMEKMFQMLQNVGKSMEARDLEIKEFEAEIKAYQAETQRISATQAGMNEQQIQDIAMGVVAAAMQGDSRLELDDTGEMNGMGEIEGMIQSPDQMNPPM